MNTRWGRSMSCDADRFSDVILLVSIALFTAEPGTTWKIGAVAKPYFPASALA